MPSIVAGDVISFTAGIRIMTDSIRVTVPNVTFTGEPGAILDGGRPVDWIKNGNVGCANAFYCQDGGDGVILENLEMRNFRKTIVYSRLTSNATYRNLYLHDSGSDGSPADPASGPQDHALYLDGGTGILVTGCRFVRLTGAGLHPYSGSGSVTTGIMRNTEVLECGFDGVHFGNASKDWLIEDCLLHDNRGNGVRSYKGVGNRLNRLYVWNNFSGNIRQDVPLASITNVVLTPPPTDPIPEPEPEPTDPCASVKLELETVRQELILVTAERDSNEAELQVLEEKLRQIHLLSG